MPCTFSVVIYYCDIYKVNQTYFEEVVNSKVDWHTELSDLTSWKRAQKKRNNTIDKFIIILYYLMLTFMC